MVVVSNHNGFMRIILNHRPLSYFPKFSDVPIGSIRLFNIPFSQLIQSAFHNKQFRQITAFAYRVSPHLWRVTKLLPTLSESRLSLAMLCQTLVMACNLTNRDVHVHWPGLLVRPQGLPCSLLTSSIGGRSVGRVVAHACIIM